MAWTRFAFQSLRSCFRSWRNTPRIIVVVGMVLSFVIIYAVPFVENAKMQGETLQITEVYTALMNWRFTMLLFSTAILIFFGDIPVREPFTTNMLMRGTRRCWVTGQIFYVVIASFAISILIFGMTILVAVPNIHLQNEWSRPVKLMTYSGRVAIYSERMITIHKSILTDYTPNQAFLHSFILFFSLGCFYGLASLALNMKFRSASFILLMSINALSWAAGMFVFEQSEYAILSILSAHYHASLYSHAAQVANPLLPSVTESYAIFLCVICIFIVIINMMVKRYDYCQAEEFVS